MAAQRPSIELVASIATDEHLIFEKMEFPHPVHPGSSYENQIKDFWNYLEPNCKAQLLPFPQWFWCPSLPLL
jgi:hypothetical protein